MHQDILGAASDAATFTALVVPRLGHGRHAREQADRSGNAEQHTHRITYLSWAHGPVLDTLIRQLSSLASNVSRLNHHQCEVAPVFQRDVSEVATVLVPTVRLEATNLHE